ncbi:MAG: PKD domain-containing protein [Methanomassiliicoccus sp.]|nr:PKD domain-containing protein [Methanomassiliicoccus sp.]
MKKIGTVTVTALLLAATFVSCLFISTDQAQAAWSGSVAVSPDSAYPKQKVNISVELTNKNLLLSISIESATYEIDWGNTTAVVALDGEMKVDAGKTTNLTGSFTTPNVDPGTYDAIVNVTTSDLISPTLSFSAPFTIDEVPLLNVTAQADPQSGTVPLEVSFTSSVMGGIPPYSYVWTTSDGSMGNDASFDHRFSTAGTYTATLEVTDSLGTSASSDVIIQAGVSGFTVRIGSSTANGVAPLSTTFTSTVTGGNGPYSYAWTTGDGGTYNGDSFTYAYNDPGTYTVRVVATDSEGNTARDLITITVLSQSNQTTSPVTETPFDVGPLLIVYIFVFVIASTAVVGFMIYRNRTRFRRY